MSSASSRLVARNAFSLSDYMVFGRLFVPEKCLTSHEESFGVHVRYQLQMQSPGRGTSEEHSVCLPCLSLSPP